MRKLFIPIAVIFIFAFMVPAHADELQRNVNETVAQMQKNLDLTDDQLAAVKQIVKAAMSDSQAVLNSTNGDMIVDKKEMRTKMLEIRNEEDQRLSKVLSEDQMKKLIAKRHIKESLNKDQIDFSESLGTGSFNPDGATMQF